MSAITLDPTEGLIEETISITGTGFDASTDITISYGRITGIDTTPETITTDGSGNFTATITPPVFYGTSTIEATDGTNPAEADYLLVREPKYCSVSDIADRLRIDINANTDPNITMIKNFIMQNEDDFDRETQHTFTTDKLVTETMDVNRLWHWLRGMPLYMRHRNIREFDPSKGDRVEVFNGEVWNDVTIPSPSGIYVEGYRGIVYIRGYIFTLLVKNRFRITYRYGGDNEGLSIPLDIQKALILRTCIDILESDFKMSQIGYGGDQNVNKEAIISRWGKEVERITDNHRELTTIW